jgi:SCY1-like protein 1
MGPNEYARSLEFPLCILTLLQEDGSNCSIFSFDINANRSRLPLAKNALRKLKTLRHPGVIRVLESVEVCPYISTVQPALTSFKTETYIYIATERVVPLSWHVRRKSLSEETAKWGLCSVAVRLRLLCYGSDSHRNRAH